MKAIPCTLIGNTSWGYCFSPMGFPSMRKAREYGRQMTDEGILFAYRIFKNN